MEKHDWYCFTCNDFVSPHHIAQICDAGGMTGFCSTLSGAKAMTELTTIRQQARREALEEAADRIGASIHAYRLNLESDYVDGLADAQCSIRALAESSGATGKQSLQVGEDSTDARLP